MELEVAWIGISLKDRGGHRFIAHDSLANSWYSLESGSKAYSIGVAGTPVAMVVDAQRRVLAYVPPLPIQQNSFPEVCSIQ
jgi:hypothetical protein